MNKQQEWGCISQTSRYRPGYGSVFIVVAVVGLLINDACFADQAGGKPGISPWSTSLWPELRWIVLGTLPLLFVVIRWFMHWSLLPPPTTQVAPGLRTTLEGELVGCEEMLRVPGHDDECVGWVCEHQGKNTWFGSTIRMGRIRPFLLKLNDGKVVRIHIDTPFWHTHWYGYRDDRIVERLERSPYQMLSEAFAEYPPGDEVSYAAGFENIRFASIDVGQHVTCSGFFTQNSDALETSGYRGLTVRESYSVTRGKELPPSQLPPRRGLEARRGRGFDTLTDNEVLLFPASYRDARRPFSPPGLAQWRKASRVVVRGLLVLFFFFVLPGYLEQWGVL